MYSFNLEPYINAHVQEAMS